RLDLVAGEGGGAASVGGVLPVIHRRARGEGGLHLIAGQGRGVGAGRGGLVLRILVPGGECGLDLVGGEGGGVRPGVPAPGCGRRSRCFGGDRILTAGVRLTPARQRRRELRPRDRRGVH